MIQFLKAVDNWILFKLIAPLAGWFHGRSGQDQFRAAHEFLDNASILLTVALILNMFENPSFWSVGWAVLLIPINHFFLIPLEHRNVDAFEAAQHTPMAEAHWPTRLFWVALFLLGVGPIGDLVAGIADMGFILLVASQYLRACTLPPPKRKKQLAHATSL